MGRDQDFSLSRHREGSATILIPVGEIDLVTVADVRAALDEAAGESRRVVLDLRQVHFMDSSGLRLLVEAQQRAAQDGFDFAVVRGPASLERLFEVTGLDARLDLHDDPGQAADGGQPGR
jgi:anti-anti-sigma factor